MKDEQIMNDPAHRGVVGRARDKVTALGVVLMLIAAIQISTGLFSIITYSRIGSFINCQGDYNQDSSVARDARLRPAALEKETLYKWLDTLPVLLGTENATPEEQQKALKKFRQKLRKAIKTYHENVETQQSNPYPAEPKETCGEY
jgi:hypothetical protein